MKFQKGDKVRVKDGVAPTFVLPPSREGVVKSTDEETPNPIAVDFSNRDVPLCFSDHELELVEVKSDPVNHPSHYKLAHGVEVIDLTELLTFNRGNAVKYLCRAGKKDPATELQDLNKALWYVQREISRVEKANAQG